MAPSVTLPDPDPGSASQPNATHPEVTIGISVHVDRLGRIVLQPARARLRYLVMVQGGLADPAPRHLIRGDVEIAHVAEHGIARSRSAVMDHCATPLLLFMDDDVDLDLDGVLALADHLVARPELSVVAGVIARKDRRVTEVEVPMTYWNTGRAMTPELLLRVDAIRDSGVRFDPDFGLKGTHPIGDEFVFLTDLLKAGHRGARVPIFLGAHPDDSTGDNWRDPAMQAARRAVLRRVFGAWGPVICLGFAVKHRKRLGGWLAALRFGTGR